MNGAGVRCPRLVASLAAEDRRLKTGDNGTLKPPSAQDCPPFLCTHILMLQPHHTGNSISR